MSTTNADMIGRDEIGDLEAILSVTNTDKDEVVHEVRSNFDTIFSGTTRRSRTPPPSIERVNARGVPPAAGTTYTSFGVVGVPDR